MLVWQMINCSSLTSLSVRGSIRGFSGASSLLVYEVFLIQCLFRMNGKASNPPSGTVVDDVVTLPERYDFFLVSQSVRQGTVNPTSYNVIKDTSGLKPNHLQVMLNLCNLVTDLLYCRNLHTSWLISTTTGLALSVFLLRVSMLTSWRSWLESLCTGNLVNNSSPCYIICKLGFCSEMISFGGIFPTSRSFFGS